MRRGVAFDYTLLQYLFTRLIAYAMERFQVTSNCLIEGHFPGYVFNAHSFVNVKYYIVYKQTLWTGFLRGVEDEI